MKGIKINFFIFYLILIISFTSANTSNSTDYPNLVKVTEVTSSINGIPTTNNINTSINTVVSNINLN